jgi:hypothetical protein
MTHALPPLVSQLGEGRGDPQCGTSVDAEVVPCHRFRAGPSRKAWKHWSTNSRKVS